MTAKKLLYIIQEQKTEIDRLKKEKENKMKPKDAHQDGFYWCPNCERAIKPRIENCKIKIKYCPFCGQALDWSDSE